MKNNPRRTSELAVKMKPIFFGIMSFIILPAIISCKEKEQIVLETYTPKVKTIIIQEESVTPEIESFGSISFVKKTDISAAVDGIIKRITTDEGDTVKTGDILAEIENIQLDIQKQQALSSITQAKAAHELAQTKYKEGQLSVEVKLLSIEKLQIEIEQKKTELDELKMTLEKKEELFDVGGISIEAINNLRLSYLSSESAYKSILKDMDIRMIGLRDKDIRERGYRVPANKDSRIELLKKINTETLAAEVSVAKAQLVSAENQLTSMEELIKELKITTPMTGILGTKYLEEGERITAGTKLFTVLDTSKVYAVFNVQEDEVLMLTEDMTVEVTIDALGGKSIKGRIDLISPIIDPQTGNVIVKALIDNEKENLKPGMFARVKVIYGSPQKKILIPVTAITRKSGARGKVFTVVNGTLFLKEVILGREDEGKIEVRKGLIAGETAVDSPSPVLKEGETVETE